MAQLALLFGICGVLASFMGAGSGEITLQGVSGGFYQPLHPSGKPATVLFFIAHDCPISNSYAPEIHRIFLKYRGKVGFWLVYSEEGTPLSIERKHARDFGFGFPAVRDPEFRLAAKVGATITPEAVVLSGTGKIAYRGRIDNVYASVGVRRFQATVHDLRNALDDLLAGRPVFCPFSPALGCFIPKSSTGETNRGGALPSNRKSP